MLFISPHIRYIVLGLILAFISHANRNTCLCTNCRSILKTNNVLLSDQMVCTHSTHLCMTLSWLGFSRPTRNTRSCTNYITVNSPPVSSGTQIHLNGFHARNISVWVFNIHPSECWWKFYAHLILLVTKNLQSFDNLHDMMVCYMTPFMRHVSLVDSSRMMGNGNTHLMRQNISRLVSHALFIIILHNCLPTDPLTLWHGYKEYLCDNLSHALAQLGVCNVSMELVYDYSLHLIKHILLLGLNKTMKDVGMSLSMCNWDTLLSNSLIQDHLQFKPTEEAEHLTTMLPLLNDEQWLAFDHIFASYLADKKETFFVIGAAGVGKTLLYNTLCHTVCSHMLVVLCIAYSGIAAWLLPGGKLPIQHSRFCLTSWMTPFAPSAKILPSQKSYKTCHF